MDAVLRDEQEQALCDLKCCLMIIGQNPMVDDKLMLDLRLNSWLQRWFGDDQGIQGKSQHTTISLPVNAFRYRVLLFMCVPLGTLPLSLTVI